MAQLDGAGNLVMRFVYGTKSNVPDYFIKRTPNAPDTTYRIVSDHLGSVRLVINVATGIIAQRMDYDAFGRPVVDSKPGFQPFGFAGGLTDTKSGFVRFGARDYDSETGRWTTRDPDGVEGSAGVGTYVYAANDPVNQVDPDGHVAIVPIIVAGAVVGAIVGGTLYSIAASRRGDFTGGGFVGALAAGGIAGGVGVVAPALGGMAGLGSGFVGAAAVNGAAGLAAGAVSAALDPCQDMTAGYLASSAGFGAIGGYLGGDRFPTYGMSNFAQVGFPRTFSGLTPQLLGGRAGINAMNAVYRGGGVAVGVGLVGPLYVH